MKNVIDIYSEEEDDLFDIKLKRVQIGKEEQKHPKTVIALQIVLQCLIRKKTSEVLSFLRTSK